MTQEAQNTLAHRVAAQFFNGDSIVELAPYGTGHINETYFVRVEGSRRPGRYILQRVNRRVFKESEKVMANIVKVTSHLRAKLARENMDPSRRALSLVPMPDGALWYTDEENYVWRVYVTIEGAHTYDIIQSTDQAYQAAKAFGLFQHLLSDLPAGELYETIPDFHHTPRRFEQFEQALSADQCNRAASAKQEIDFAFARKGIVSTLVDCIADGSMRERVTHNDTKLNNVMIDDDTGEGICIIDLDTVMAGLALYDFGDCVRSGTRTGREDETNLDLIRMDMSMFEALVRGYMETSSSFLSLREIELLAFSGKLITFEIGLRFFTDYLSGDVYFKTHRERHNLDRVRVQFKLMQSMEEQEEEMNKLVARYG